ncbi:glycosyltransferase family 52 [Enterobacter wuhouensis]|jgi:beta-galactosamide-alpha-2,3-sialyltransferase|uniref:glycosyltransferase family 52 n=1 Tax=Enterobacter wuhouensis TaxID=2529381 RepID=UPI002FDE551E
MNLVVCFTPLQILIAMQVIDRENIDYNDIHFVYFSPIMDIKHQKYYLQIASRAKKSTHIKEVYSFRLLRKIKKHFGLSRYNNVLLASIDDSITHYLLSYIKFNKLITFDDGLGNILKTGSYFVKHQRTTIKKKLFSVIHLILGRKYYLDDVKHRVDRHYTIYKHFENCVQNPIPISLFKFESVSLNPDKSIDIFLGTIYKEIVIQGNEQLLKDEVINFIESFSSKPIYIPHPRAVDDEFKKYELKSEDIAEDVVQKYLNDGFVVNLYGFASSCQFNLSGVKNVNIFVLDSQCLSPAMKDGLKMLSSTLPEEHHIHL